MLKKFCFILICLLLLSACRPQEIIEDSSEPASILCYEGIPALSLLGLDNELYTATISADIDELNNAFENQEYDYIISPIIEGISNIQDNLNYKLLAIIGDGQLYGVAKEEDSAASYLGVVANDSLTTNVLNYLENTDLHRFSYSWFDSYDELISSYSAGIVDAMLINELEFIDLTNYQGFELYKIEDIQQDIEYQTNYSSYPMYALFVNAKTLVNKQSGVVEFSKLLKSNINTYTNDKTTFNEILESSDLSLIGFDNKDLISESYNYCGITFKYAREEKEEIKNILEICDSEFNELIIVE